jgi:hypothetical protein
MIINSAGNVGIGTTSPGSTLHVQGNVSASSYTSSLGFLVTGSTGYRHTSGSVTSLLRANPTTNAVEFGAETFHVVNMTINGSSLYQFGVGAFIPFNAGYNLGALVNPWDKVYATTVSASSYNSSLTSGVGYFGTASHAVTASYALTAPGGGLSGGTTNYIPLWTSATAQSSSNLYQSSSNIGIGTITPGTLLHVQGAISGSTMTLTGTATVQSLVETSTQELKKNITPMESTVTTLSKLEPSRFNWISTDEPDIGLIAEQVEQIFPELVTHDVDGKLIGVKYSKLTVLLLKAVQEMSQRIESLEQQSIYKSTH